MYRMKRHLPGGGEKHLQMSIAEDESFIVKKQPTAKPKQFLLFSDERKLRKILKYVVKRCDGSESVHVQKRLKAYRSAIELVFRAQDLWESHILTSEQIADGLWRLFPLYNLPNEEMKKIIDSVREVMDEQNRVIIPCQLLGLAVLNVVDSRLQKNTASRYFKTKYIKDRSMGRRSYASRLLRGCGYIEESGTTCWRRTDKEFDEKDLC
jgi:hypothetical protein